MRYLVLQEFPDIDYVLIARYYPDNQSVGHLKVHDFVAAFHFDTLNQVWAQGHYFINIVDAVKHIEGKLQELNR